MFSRSSSASFRTRSSPSTGEITNSPARESGALAHAVLLGTAQLPRETPCFGAGEQASQQVWGQNQVPLLQTWQDWGGWGLRWMYHQVPAGEGGGLNGQISGARARWLGLSEDANSAPSTCPCPEMPRAVWAMWHGPPELRGCVLIVPEKLCSGVSWELELGSAFQIP